MVEVPDYLYSKLFFKVHFIEIQVTGRKKKVKSIPKKNLRGMSRITDKFLHTPQYESVTTRYNVDNIANTSDRIEIIAYIKVYVMTKY